MCCSLFAALRFVVVFVACCLLCVVCLSLVDGCWLVVVVVRCFCPLFVGRCLLIVVSCFFPGLL